MFYAGTVHINTISLMLLCNSYPYIANVFLKSNLKTGHIPFCTIFYEEY